MGKVTDSRDLPAAVRAAGIEMSMRLPGGPRFAFPGFGTFDLSTISLRTAETLLAANFPYLQRRRQAKRESEMPPPQE